MSRTNREFRATHSNMETVTAAATTAGEISIAVTGTVTGESGSNTADLEEIVGLQAV